MPSSDTTTVPKILAIIRELNPQSILDIGPGNGRNGLLFRESLDWDWGRLKPESWQLQLDGIEIDRTYLTPVHQYVYNKIYVCDWLYNEPTQRYDLIFMGDVLEHFQDGNWQEALSKSNDYAKFTIVVAPNWPGSVAQNSWHGHHQEKHWVALTPQMVGGRCLFANSKIFICGFDNEGNGVMDGKDICM